MRLIDVDALTKRLVEFCNKSCPYTAKARNVMCGSCFMGLALEAVEDAPTIEPDLKWIPCSEKLPESIKPVIITWRNNDPKSYYQYIVGKPFIGTGHYCKGKWFWYSSTCEDLLAEYGRSDVDEVDEAIEVIAWMPLPESYSGE